MDLQQFTQQSNHQEVTDWINLALPAQFKLENPPSIGDVEHIIDYLNDRMERGRKTKFKKMSFQDAERLSKEWVESLTKKGLNIVETDYDVEEVAQLEEDLRLVKLVGKNAFEREGALMSHCVSSYYGKDTKIYSIRDGRNMPHCTLEVSGDNANQVKGKGNGEIHPKYINAVMQALKILGKEVRKSEMTYLGYREVSSEILSLYKKNFPNLKNISYQGSIFVYRAALL